MPHFKLIGMIFYQEITNILVLRFHFKRHQDIIKMIQQIIDSILTVKLFVISTLNLFLMILLQNQIQ